jgi:glycosyltransferase involved in cell wall biosynthesis
MKILCVTPWFPRHRQDQRGNFILDSVEALQQQGHEVMVLVTEPWRPRIAGLFNKNWRSDKIKLQQFTDIDHLHVCRYISIPRSYFSHFSHNSYRKTVNPLLEELARTYHCDVIHAHTELAAIAAADVGKKLNIPTIATLHGISTEKKLYRGKIKNLLYDYALANIDQIVLVGEPLKEFFQRWVSNKDFKIVANGFRPHVANAQLINASWQEKNLRFISVANLEEGKGIDIALAAFAIMQTKGITNWTYKIIGDGAERTRLEKAVRALRLEHQVTFTGACAHDLVYQHLQQADVFVLPSYREAFGVAYLEAMSCGLLAIGVAGQGPEAFIEHKKKGLLVPPRDSETLAWWLQKIINERVAMQNIAAAGQVHVQRNFTWRQHAERLTKVYQELIR